MRGLRVRRKLHALADARRQERRAAAVVEAEVAALARHGDERTRVLMFCRHEQRAGGQWYATLRAHDAMAPVLQQSLSNARQAHELARQQAGEALRAWQIERARHDDAKARGRAALARVASEGREHG
ncbi:hypothetical protein [Paraburkholderia agricolaris]|uniref:hypothetical protein n=1 Tax=Paraburkholderia agricolaris TaxID=2152888 RepID=UPI001FE919EF|nr:hypothetical protein [Paraburkholderia agricolaris]